MRGGIFGGIVLAAGCSLACGDGSPTTPTTTVTNAQLPTSDFPAGTSLRVVSGENRAPVPGAEVTVGADALVTDDAGTITLEHDFNEGTLVDIEAPGFLFRQTRLRRLTGAEFRLWPKESSTGLTEAFVFDVVYQLAQGGESSHMMRIRPLTDMAFVVPSARILGDARAMRAVYDAIDELNAIARGEVNFAVAPDPPPGSIYFELVIDPAELEGNVVGQALRRLSGWNIVGGTVTYDSLETARTSATHHELGHMFGLGHSDSRADVMFPFLHRRVETFAPRERLAMRLMLDRPAANRLPDNDRDVASAQTLKTEWVSVISCSR